MPTLVLQGIVFIAICLPCSGAQCNFPSLTPVQKEDPYHLVKALVESFGWAKSALERWDQDKLMEGDALAAFGEMMFQIKLANQDYQCSADVVEGYTKSSTKGIRTSAEGAKVTYILLIHHNKQLLNEIEKAANDPGGEGVGTFLARLSDLRVQINDSWKMLVLASIAATHALVQVPEGEDERVSRLVLTARQRKDLIGAIEEHFGDDVKAGMKAGQSSLVASAAALHQFLSDRRWKSSDEK